MHKSQMWPVILVFWCSLTAAQEIAGLGAAPCKDFSQAMQQRTNSAAPVYFTWAQGFISAMNLVRHRRKLPAKTLGNNTDYTPAKQLAYLADYCRRNPTRDFAAATVDLYLNLPAKSAH